MLQCCNHNHNLRSVVNLKEGAFQSVIETLEAPTLHSVFTHAPFGTGVRFNFDNSQDYTGFVLEIWNGNQRVIFQGLRFQDRSTNFYSENELGAADSYKFIIYATKNGERGKALELDVRPEYKKLGDNYDFEYYPNTEYFVDAQTNGVTEKGWDLESEEWIATAAILDRIIEEFKQRPISRASDIPIKITGLLRSGAAFKLPEWFELQADPRMAIDSPEQAYKVWKHELEHLFACPPNWSVDKNGNYIPDFSGFEEGRAQYTEGKDTIRISMIGNNYDYYNQMKALTNNNYWWMRGGAGEQYVAYGMGRETFRKIELEHPGLIFKTHEWVYDYFNKSGESGPIGKELIYKCWKELLGDSTIEGKNWLEWCNAQKNFDCVTVEGYKIFPIVRYYYDSGETVIEIKFFYYYTFADTGNGYNGNYEGNQGQLYNQNGKTGILKFGDRPEKELVILNRDGSTGNPPEMPMVGSARVVITSLDNVRESGRINVPGNYYEFHRKYAVGSEVRVENIVFEIEGKNILIPLILGKLDGNATAFFVDGEKVEQYNGPDGVVEFAGFKRNFKSEFYPHVFLADGMINEDFTEEVEGEEVEDDVVIIDDTLPFMIEDFKKSLLELTEKFNLIVEKIL